MKSHHSPWVYHRPKNLCHSGCMSLVMGSLRPGPHEGGQLGSAEAARQRGVGTTQHRKSILSKGFLIGARSTKWLRFRPGGLLRSVRISSPRRPPGDVAASASSCSRRSIASLISLQYSIGTRADAATRKLNRHCTGRNGRIVTIRNSISSERLAALPLPHGFPGCPTAFPVSDSFWQSGECYLEMKDIKTARNSKASSCSRHGNK